MAIPNRTKPERIYVKVASEFDSTGYMLPTSITWADGRTFPIETVRDFRPAGTADNDCNGDCFTVLIQGHEKHLFFNTSTLASLDGLAAGMWSEQPNRKRDTVCSARIWQ